jgi:single-stranded-DNA-specific exonuclease
LPKGVVGLAAGRLAEMYKRPVIVLERGEIESTGSARAQHGFNMVECLKYASGFLIKYGGHMQAAGLTVHSHQIDEFYKGILEYAQKNPQTESGRELELEAELSGSDLSLQTYNEVSRLEPYGMGNPKPIFAIRNAELIQVRAVGASQKHAQVTVKVDGTQVAGIGFSFVDRLQKFVLGDRVDIAAELMADSWNGYQNLKLKIFLKGLIMSKVLRMVRIL